MATANDVLNLARSQLGVHEVPMGSNRGTPYHAWYGAYSQGWQWCAIFQCWLFSHIDPNLIHGIHSAYSGDYLTVGKRHGEEIKAPVPGAIAIMDYNADYFTDHIGIVESVSGNNMLLIEGNHNNRVERVNRQINSSTRFWYIYPKYQDVPEPPPEKRRKANMYVSPQEMPKQKDLFVWVMPEGVNQLAVWPTGAHCWLNVHNENPTPVKVIVFTSPSSGEHRMNLGGWQRKSLDVGSLVRNAGHAGGFSTVVKCKSDNIAMGVSIFED